MPLSLLFQDVIVTGLAVAALVVLVRRTVGVLRPSADASPCGACPSCERPAREEEGGSTTVVPLADLRGRHRIRPNTASQPSPSAPAAGRS